MWSSTMQASAIILIAVLERPEFLWMVCIIFLLFC